MAKSPANAAQNTSAAKEISLQDIANATRADPFYMFASPADIQVYIDAGTADINPAIKNPANDTEVAVRATPKGLEQVGGTSAGQPATAGASERPGIIRLKRPVSVLKRERRGATSRYPFDDLAEPTGDEEDGFFVAATASRPEPWKTLASTVSTAQQRFSTKTGETPYQRKNKETGELTTAMRATYVPNREFRLMESEHEGVKGAWVFRVK